MEIGDEHVDYAETESRDDDDARAELQLIESMCVKVFDKCLKRLFS